MTTGPRFGSHLTIGNTRWRVRAKAVPVSRKARLDNPAARAVVGHPRRGRAAEAAVPLHFGEGRDQCCSTVLQHHVRPMPAFRGRKEEIEVR